MLSVIERIKQLQNELGLELKAENPDNAKISKLRAKIFMLGIGLTRNDIYNKQ